MSTIGAETAHFPLLLDRREPYTIQRKKKHDLTKRVLLLKTHPSLARVSASCREMLVRDPLCALTLPTAEKAPPKVA